MQQQVMNAGAAYNFIALPILALYVEQDISLLFLIPFVKQMLH